jgi:hypothetical protein
MSVFINAGLYSLYIKPGVSLPPACFVLLFKNGHIQDKSMTALPWGP